MAQLRPRIVLGVVTLEFTWIAIAVGGVLTHEMDDGETVVARNLAIGDGVLQAVVLNDHAAVETVELLVAHVELCLAELRIVEEKTAAEVIDGFLCLRKELVGDERHVVAGLSEEFRK